MAEVFISYKRERRPAARHLEQILIRYGYTVWFDLALVRGKDYEAQIEHELTAAKAVIVLWCKLSVASEGVRSEANRAKSDDKLIPLVIEPCRLPLFSTLDQNIDLSAVTGSPRDPALDPLLDDLERLIGRPPQPDLKALREYEATWRSMGAWSLAGFPLEEGIVMEAVIGRGAGAVAGPPTHDYAFWERQWEKHGMSTNLVVLHAIVEEAPRYFAEQARARIAEIEVEQKLREAEEARKAEAGGSAPRPQAVPYPRNSEELWNWLKKRSIEVSRAIAARAALRQLPWASDTAERFAQKRASPSPGAPTTADEDKVGWLQHEEALLDKADSHLLRVFHANAIAWFAAVGSNHATAEIRTAALNVAHNIRDDMFSYGMRATSQAHAAALTAYVDSVRNSPRNTSFEPAGRYAARAAAPNSVSEAASDVTAAARIADLQWFERGQTGPALMATPLWPDINGPQEWVSQWQRLRTALRIIDPSWAVWITWYEDRVRGAPFKVEIERQRLLVPDEFPNGPPAAVNAQIAQLVANAR